MKITFDEKDIPLLLANNNENTFLMAAVKKQNSNSTEAWGFPNFKQMVFKTESEIWKDHRVKDAIEKVKEYAKKKNYKIATPQQAQTAKQKLFSTLTEVDSIAKGLVATIKQPKFIKVNGITIFACQATFQQAAKGESNKSRLDAALAGGAAIPIGVMASGGSAIGGMAAYAGVSVAVHAISSGLSKLVLYLTNRKKMGYYDSFVPFVNDKGKLIWSEFGSFLVGDIKADEMKVETVESYKVDMNAFSSEDEEVTIVNCGTDLSGAEDEPPTTEVILDSSDADGSETPVKDVDEQAIEEIKMDEETAESFEALTRNDESFLDDEFVFV